MATEPRVSLAQAVLDGGGHPWLYHRENNEPGAPATKATFIFQPLEETHARTILEWHYEPPYDVYDLSAGNAEEVVQDLLHPEYAYHAMLSPEGELVAFCCFGQDGQVPGGDYSEEALDIGLGVRPDLTGQGESSSFVQAVLEFAQRTWPQPAFRVTIAEFNVRAQRVWEKAGFLRVQRFESTRSSRPFLIYLRDV
jgi:RimJ/RimL family protein N-acetyltransferase